MFESVCALKNNVTQQARDYEITLWTLLSPYFLSWLPVFRCVVAKLSTNYGTRTNFWKLLESKFYTIHPNFVQKCIDDTQIVTIRVV